MANITKVYLLNVPLENDYKNTLYFNKIEAQTKYFQSRKIKEYTNFSYQRKDSFIRVPDHFDNLQNVNYVMYQNSAYSNKWFYAFVTDIKYVDDGRTDLVIETDYIQTWFFDYNVKASFVEREHVSDDTIGIHTIPENLDTGDYIVQDMHFIPDFTTKCYVIGTTRDYNENFKKVGGQIYNGIYSGIKYYAFWNSDDITNFIKEYDEAGYSDDIICMFAVPEWLTGLAYDQSHWVQPLPKTFDANQTKSISIKKPTTLDGYTPRNKKLLTSPYQYLLVDNNAGTSVTYNYELFKLNTMIFQVYASLTPGCSMILVPSNYPHGTENVNGDPFPYGITLGKYPICNWTSDLYTNWQTQNGLNNALGIGVGIAKIVGGVGATIVTGGVGSVIGGSTAVSGVAQVTDVMKNMYERSFLPAQSKGNVNSGDVITSAFHNEPEFYEMSIKKEYAEIIDKYFDMFGYKVNMVKIPNKAHRSRYWYTKTIDVNIDGPIPNKDMQIIKNAYNNGITFWRNANEIQDYSLSNEIAIIE